MPAIAAESGVRTSFHEAEGFSTSLPVTELSVSSSEAFCGCLMSHAQHLVSGTRLCQWLCELPPIRGKENQLSEP